MATCLRGGSGTNWGIGGPKGWQVPSLHPRGAPLRWGGCCWARGAPRVPAVPGEPRRWAPSPAGFPARLLPRGRGLGTVGTEIGQVCTQIRAERLGARVPLGASWCHPWLCTGLRWHRGIPEGFWGERWWGVTRGSRTGSLQWQGDVTGVVTAPCRAAMGAATLQQAWDVGSLDPSPFPPPAHVARRGGWFRFAVSSCSHFLTCEWRRSNLVCSR